MAFNFSTRGKPALRINGLIEAVIARGGGHNETGLESIGNSLLDQCVRMVHTKTHVNDIDTIVDGPLNSLGDGEAITETVFIEGAIRNQGAIRPEIRRPF